MHSVRYSSKPYWKVSKRNHSRSRGRCPNLPCARRCASPRRSWLCLSIESIQMHQAPFRLSAAEQHVAQACNRRGLCFDAMWGSFLAFGAPSSRMHSLVAQTHSELHFVRFSIPHEVVHYLSDLIADDTTTMKPFLQSLHVLARACAPVTSSVSSGEGHV